jgi:hypothetical protein
MACVAQQASLRSLSEEVNGSCYESTPVTFARGPDRVELCEALERNLNAFCDSPPMVCGLELSTEELGLELPEWRELDTQENMDVLEDLVKGKWLRVQSNNPGLTDRIWSQVSAELEDSEPGEPATVSMTAVDIMNRGALDTVYALDTGTCQLARDEGFKYGPRIFVQQDAEVMRNPEWRARAEQGQPPYPGSSQLGTYPFDVFRFQGRTYQFRWESRPSVIELVAPPSLESMDVDPQISGLAVFTVCEFNYRTQ